MMEVTNKNGAIIDFEIAMTLMDDEICEQIHNSFETETDQEFFDAYEKAHEEKYGEEWELSKANPIY